MKKILLLVLVLSFTLLFMGCGDDDSDAVTKISIKNSTNAEILVNIDGIDLAISNNETTSYVFDNAIFGDDESVNLDYEVHGLFVETVERVVTIVKNETTNLEIISEGGVVSLKNDHYINITSALIYPANDAPGGANILTDPLEPGDSITVIREPGDYKVLLNLVNGEFKTLDTFTIEDNQMITVSYLAQKSVLVNNLTDGFLTFKFDQGDYNRLNANQSEEYILGPEYGLNVDASFNGLYIFAGTDSFDFYETESYEVNVTADGGAIFIVNQTSDNIVEVYLSPSSSEEWGADYMSGSIGSGDDYAWTVEPGFWDVKIVDDAGFYSEIFDVEISLNQSEYIDYSDKAKSHHNKSTTKNKAHYNYPVGGTRVEGN